MAWQNQAVGSGKAYQAGGNLTVVNGMDAEQMAAVMVAMANQLQVHFAQAEAKLEARLSDFQKAVLEEFAKPENEAATTAFAEPDFQFVLSDAQKVFARDGSVDLRDDLVKLLVQRSKHDGRDRIAKILNHAIALAGSFSKNEYAALSINFLLINVKISTPSRDDLIDKLTSYVRPFYEDLIENPTVYEYIEAQQCGSINYVITRDLTDHFFNEYGSVLSHGFSIQDFAKTYPGGDMSIYTGLIIGTSSFVKPYRFAANNALDLANELRHRGLPDTAVERAVSLYNLSIPNQQQVMQILRDEVVGFDRVMDIWNSTALSKITLNAVGKAIAHSSLASRAPFVAPLSIWVQ